MQSGGDKCTGREREKKKCLHAIKVVQMAIKQSAAPPVQMARKQRRPGVYEHYHIHGYINFKDNDGRPVSVSS